MSLDERADAMCRIILKIRADADAEIFIYRY